MATGSRIGKVFFFFKWAKLENLPHGRREMSFFYNLNIFYKYFSISNKTS